MDKLFDVLLAVLPSVIVFLTAFYLLKRFMDNESRKQLVDMKLDNRKTILPIRLQAYERIALYLERIHPNTLIMRTHKTGMSARLLQSELLKTVRSEYDHNVAQQIYVSQGLWDAVRAAKEETLKIINIASSKVSDDATGLELSKRMFDLCGQLEKIPSDFAIDVLKKEIKRLF